MTKYLQRFPLVLFAVFTYVGTTWSRRKQLQVLPCVKRSWENKIHGKTVHAPSLWRCLYFQFVDANFRAKNG